jgi:type IV pilus assembly protein PilC
VEVRYWAIDEEGNAVDGVLSTASVEEARAQLESKGMSILSLKPGKRIQLKTPVKFSKALPAEDQLAFFLQLNVLLGGGLPITYALEALIDGVSDALGKVVEQVLTRVESGMRFSSAVASTEVFPRITITALRIAEQTGALSVVLGRLAERLRKAEARRRELISMLAYPLAIGLVSAGLLALMMYVMVPQFVTSFSQLGGELPGPTLFLIRLTEGPWLPLLGVLTVLGFGGLWVSRHSPTTRTVLEQIRYETPVLGVLSRKSLLCRVSENLAMMLELGLPLDKALRTVREPTTGYYAMDEVLKAALVELRETGNVMTVFEESVLFPPMWLHMTAVGLETGRMPQLLNSYSSLVEAEVESDTQSLTQMIEPLMLGFMGIVVGSVVLASFLPMYSILEKL